MAWDEATHEQYRRSRMRYQSDVTDEEWEVITPLLPAPSRKGRPRTTDLREVFDAIQYMLASGKANWFHGSCKSMSRLQAKDR